MDFFLFAKTSTLSLSLTKLPVQRLLGTLSQGVKRPKREADHSLSSIAEVKDEWSHTSISTTYLHDVHRNKRSCYYVLKQRQTQQLRAFNVANTRGKSRQEVGFLLKGLKKYFDFMFHKTPSFNSWFIKIPFGMSKFFFGNFTENSKLRKGASNLTHVVTCDVILQHALI
jgi:hypothetical protein